MGSGQLQHARQSLVLGFSDTWSGLFCRHEVQVISAQTVTRMNARASAVGSSGQSNRAGFSHSLENFLLCLSRYGMYSRKSVSEI